MKFNVSALKFVAPQPEILPQSGSSLILDKHVPGWTAEADTESRLVKVTANVFDRQINKSVRKPFQVPFESIRWMNFLASKVQPSPDTEE